MKLGSTFWKYWKQSIMSIMSIESPFALLRMEDGFSIKKTMSSSQLQNNCITMSSSHYRGVSPSIVLKNYNHVNYITPYQFAPSHCYAPSSSIIPWLFSILEVLEVVGSSVLYIHFPFCYVFPFLPADRVFWSRICQGQKQLRISTNEELKNYKSFLLLQ